MCTCVLVIYHQEACIGTVLLELMLDMSVNVPVCIGHETSI